MLKILIDAKQRNIKQVTLFKDGIEVAKKEGDIDIVTEIQNILTEQNLKLDQIDSFDFANGPGSFTGIKTGAAIANILQWSLKDTPIDKLPVPEYGAEPNIMPQPKS
jgi:tRNA A37 threonylcarbamoyladenosine modification protein TsaB